MNSPSDILALIPDVDGQDHATLAAWYSGFAYSEHYRKVVLSNAKEMLRAAVELAGQKVTEARLDDLARIHPTYLSYLATHLHGRIQWEKEFLAQGGFR